MITIGEFAATPLGRDMHRMYGWERPIWSRLARYGREIGAGDTVEVLVRPEHGVTVRDWFAARFGLARGSADPGLDDRGLADADALEVLAKRRLSAHATGDITLSSDMLRRAEQAAGRSVVD